MVGYQTNTSDLEPISYCKVLNRVYTVRHEAVFLL